MSDVESQSYEDEFEIEDENSAEVAIDDAETASVASDVINIDTIKNVKGGKKEAIKKKGGEDDSSDEEEIDDENEVDEAEIIDDEAAEAELEETGGGRRTIDKIVNAAEKQKNVQLFKKIVEILPERRKTSNMLTRFEMTEIISVRTQQISEGSAHFINIENEALAKLTDPRDIAELEFNLRRCPLRLRRKIGEKKIN